jgi:hypothetical protein
MARQSATTKATGGGGYTFADNVAAGFLVNILQGRTPFDHSFGPPGEIHFETRDSGHILDDLLVVLGARDSETRAAISVKSGRELTAAGFSDEFAKDAWEEWHRPGFDIKADLLVLVVGVVGDGILNQWRQLQEQAASTTPERLVARLADENQSSAFNVTSSRACDVFPMESHETPSNARDSCRACESCISRTNGQTR